VYPLWGKKKEQKTTTHEHPMHTKTRGNFLKIKQAELPSGHMHAHDPKQNTIYSCRRLSLTNSRC